MGDEQMMTVKAAGDMELDVTGVPFDSVDSDKQWFSQNTDTMPDNFPNPPVFYYHGLDPNGKPMGEPQLIGKVSKIEKQADGWHYTVLLDKANEFAQRIWKAAQDGTARASSGSIAHIARLLVNGVKKLYDRMTPGEIIKWPVAELSLIDAEGQRQPANKYAVALPVMKSVYTAAGLLLPDIPVESEPDTAEAEQENRADGQADGATTKATQQLTGEREMDEQEVSKLVADGVAAALKAQREADDAAKKAAEAEQEKH